MIGVKKLETLRKKYESNSKSKETERDKKNKLVFAAVAAVIFSNSDHNIGVYTPRSAKYNAANQIAALATIFMAMTAILCIAAYYLLIILSCF